MELPRLFIGSSREGLEVASYLQAELEYAAESTIWSQGVFEPSGSALEGLIVAARDTDFAALVLTPDDLVTKRSRPTQAPRDNVLFELGLFMGVLGRERTFMVFCRDEPIELPTDMAGITAVTFAKRSDGNLQAALGPVCIRMKAAMAAQGRRNEGARPEDQTLARLLVLRYVNEHELGHLRKLDGAVAFDYRRSAVFQAELRRLRELGLLRSLDGHSVARMPAEGDAREHVEITDEGRAYLAMRLRLERDESLIQLSELRLKKLKPWLSAPSRHIGSEP